MPDPDAYIALISSLPSSERLFVAKQPPLSRLRLEKRLTVLTQEDRATLDLMERLLAWRSYDMTDDTPDALRRAKTALTDLDSETLRAIVVERMDLRTAIAALRLRRDGEMPPTAAWGTSRLTRHIAANWNEPTFRLDRQLPWLREAAALLERRAPLGLERHILDVTFRQLKRHAGRHLFDLEAVVIYVLKWNIFDRWSRTDARAAAHRFETLAQSALDSFDGARIEGAA